MIKIHLIIKIERQTSFVAFETHNYYIKQMEPLIELDKEDISVVGEGCIVNLAPDDDEKIEKCKEYGKAIVS